MATKKRKSLLMLGDEILSPLCTDCKCCLANSTHCWICHTTIPIADLCRDGMCEQIAHDLIDRYAAKQKANEQKIMAMNFERTAA